MGTGINTERLEPLIFRIRGHRVVLDADLARLYGVNTGPFNQAFKRNRHRFPEDFAFRLSAQEVEALRSQFVTSNKQAPDLSGTMWSQFVTTYQRRHSHLPWAFTEHGALMVANVLRTGRAVQMSIFLVRAFVRLREQIAANTAILKRLAEIDKTLLQHDAALSELYRRLLSLLEQPETPSRAIGFHADID